MNIYVGQLPYRMTERDLRVMFEEFGELESVRIVSDRITGRSKGFGFVEMSSDSEAAKAMKSLDGRVIDGKNIKVIPADSGAGRAKRGERAISTRRLP